jgi:dCTP deaminase
MILTGEEIKREVAAGGIQITPFEAANVNPASIDLRLGTQVRCYKSNGVIDPKEPQETQLSYIPLSGFIIRPGQLYLMHTVERICTQKYVPVLDGKSSIGRLGILIHLTAGYGDPGFDGQYTLEVTCIQPVRLYPRMKIAQMRFHAMQGELVSYKGNYTGEASEGAVASMAHRQFEKL